METYKVFQFQLGAIKGTTSGLRRSPTNSFQFQLGAIKGIPAFHSEPDDISFQFQLGAIKGPSNGLLVLLEYGFNSN